MRIRDQIVPARWAGELATLAPAETDSRKSGSVYSELTNQAVLQMSRFGGIQLVLAVAILWSSTVGALAQSRYSSGSTGVDGIGPFASYNIPPPIRIGALMAFDRERQQMIMFGGGSPASSLQKGGTWTWDGKDWMMLTTNVPTGDWSDPLGMVYDEERKEIVLVGNPGRAELPNGVETWVWNGTVWSQKVTTVQPSRRFNHSIAYDRARKRVVLYGGAGLGDTWLWDGVQWTEKTPSTTPGPRDLPAMVYDAAREEVLLFGGYGAPNDTWLWNGETWRRAAVDGPSHRFQAGTAYDEVRKKVVLFGGSADPTETWTWDGTTWSRRIVLPAPTARTVTAMAFDPRFGTIVLSGSGQHTPGHINDTWTWNGTNWFAVSGSFRSFDLSAKSDGVWSFTDILVPPGLTVVFHPAPGNPPVKWLASGNVTIAGTLNLCGEAGFKGGQNLNPAPGGPGGFAGGIGGQPVFQESSPAGGAGQGPGGGAPGVAEGENGQAGKHVSIYGNPFLVPLVGGSGGGGGAASGSTSGYYGGGGGGAISIAASGDLTVSGSILANGGFGPEQRAQGSGGAIKLIANQINLTKTSSLQANNDGAIRLEAYDRVLAGNIEPGDPAHTYLSAPAPEPAVGVGKLLIEKVAGNNIEQPPRGDLFKPDVIFTDAGDITVSVLASNVPDGTSVKLRVTLIGDVMTKPDAGEPEVKLVGGKADFTFTVPKGRGTLQALADFQVP